MSEIGSESAEVASAEKEIQRIEHSLRCFQFALIGCIPVIGLPWAFASLREFRQVKHIGLKDWNAGARYLSVGRVVGWLALVFNVILWTLAAITVAYEVL